MEGKEGDTIYLSKKKQKTNSFTSYEEQNVSVIISY